MLGWGKSGFEVTNSLAYFSKVKITAKKFYKICQWTKFGDEKRNFSFPKNISSEGQKY
jgi:hypothetical protein